MKRLVASVFRENKITCIIILILLCATGCNEKNKKETNGTSATPKIAGLSATFHNLYVSKAELQAIRNTYPDAHFKKFVFTFLFPANSAEGSPTLALWPSKKNNQNNNPEYPGKPPQILHYAATSYVDIPKNLFLSNLLADSKPIYTAIDTNRACLDKCVLYFIPDGKGTLCYKIFVVPDSTKITKDNLQLLSSIAILNPSPPRSGD